VGSIHDDGVLYLGVADSGVVADCCVWAYVGVRPDGAVVADDGETSDGCPAVDDGAPAYLRANLSCLIISKILV